MIAAGEPLPDVTGAYVALGTQGGCPAYKHADADWFLFWTGTQWAISAELGGAMAPTDAWWATPGQPNGSPNGDYSPQGVATGYVEISGFEEPPDHP